MYVDRTDRVSQTQRIGSSRALRWLGGCCVAALAACAPSADQPAARSLGAGLDGTEVSAILRDAEGADVGQVMFASDGESTYVTVSAYLPPDQHGIHGIHIHANDVPDNGEGCIADPEQPASTHFVSVDGHFNPGGGHHGEHQGDLPALFFTEAGEASLQFLTDRFQAEDVIGRAVILHQSSDNYGNVPVGDGPDQYTPNSDDATSLTAKTGNAGARIACGVIE